MTGEPHGADRHRIAGRGKSPETRGRKVKARIATREAFASTAKSIVVGRCRWFLRLPVNGDILCNVACVRRQIALLRWLHTLRRDGWGETGLVYEDRDDVAPDLDIGDAAYAITRCRECATVQRSEPIQTIDAQ